MRCLIKLVVEVSKKYKMTKKNNKIIIYFKKIIKKFDICIRNKKRKNILKN